MASSNGTQDATSMKGFTKLHLKSQEPEDSLGATLARAFNEERLCTMTVKTTDGTIPVHKIVLCLKSSVIAKAMTGKFQGAQESCFDLSHEDTESVSRFVQFCYLSRYDTVDRAQHSGADLALTKDEDGVVQYVGNTATQSPKPMVDGRGRDRGDLPSNGSCLLSTGWGKAAQDSAKNSAYTLNAKRLELDITMWRMGDTYDVQRLKSYAASQLETRLSALRKHGSSLLLLLEIIHPIYECTANNDDDLRRILIRSLTRFKRKIGVDPLLRSYLHTLARGNDDLMAYLVDGWLDAPEATLPGSSTQRFGA